MKKKAIEKIPYLGLPVMDTGPEVRFIGVTAVKTIAGEEHFFLEIYRNEKNNATASRGAGEVPVMRIVVMRRDFGTYTPEDGNWSRERVRSMYYEPMLWDDDRIAETVAARKKANILASAEDLRRLKNFFLGVHLWDDEAWWEVVAQAQKVIVTEEKNLRLQRRRQRREQALRDRMEHTPPLPEQEILSWADGALFKHQHYLYYKKKNRRATICCSACGGVTTKPWREGMSYESQFEDLIHEPVANHFGTCPMCGATGIYKPQGRIGTLYSVQLHIWKADRYKETGAVVRYIQIEKSWSLDMFGDGNGGMAMNGAHEELTLTEVARKYLYEGKVQTDFQKSGPGGCFWDDCNLSGIVTITVKEAPLYPGFSESLKGTPYQYSAIELYTAAKGNVNAADYLERYQRTPQIEMLVKLKLYGVVRELLWRKDSIVADKHANRPETFLGIRKEKLKSFIEVAGDPDILRVLQIEKRMGQSWTESQVDALVEMNATQHQLEPVLKVMGIQKLLNLISSYAGCDYGTGCTQAEYRLRDTAGAYFDYIQMRVQLGYDLHNTVYQRPRILRAAHDKMVLETNKDKLDRRLKEVEEKYPLIRKNYRRLRKQLLYEDDDYIIRPARSAEEIVTEGRILHHCVGGDHYLSQHNSGKSFILMLRRKEKLEEPYITVQLRDGAIVQWYGMYDRKPEEEKMQRWLDAYVVRLRCGGIEDGTEAAAVQIQIPA